MSYILDALKKSDQQRQRGATPTLQAAQVTVPASGRPVSLYYGLLALVLLLIGITIGWLRPWQEVQSTGGAAPVPAQRAAPAISELAAVPVQPTMLPDSPPVVAPVVEKPARIAEAPASQDTLRFEELPLSIQREIPAMAIQLHAYARKPAERLVSINSIRLREGGQLMAGLRLEEITPDGMIFSYRGYRFRRGIR